MNKRESIIAILAIILSLNFVFAQETSFGERINTSAYEISRSKIEVKIPVGDVFKDSFMITNKGPRDLSVSYEVEGDAAPFFRFEFSGLFVPSNDASSIPFTIAGKETGEFLGTLNIKGEINEKIQVNISFVGQKSNPKLILEINSKTKKFVRNKKLQFNIDVIKIVTNPIYNATFEYALLYPNKTEAFNLGGESVNIMSSFNVLKEYNFPKELENGEYLFSIIVSYENLKAQNEMQFVINLPWYKYKFLGIPLWAIILFALLIASGITSFVMIKRFIAKRKKYKMSVDFKKIAKKEQGNFYFGKVAETTRNVYFEPTRFMTHTIIAGATGGGKSIAAQVIVEEALIKNTAVVVFDPTAQWSGMLRKCTDKRMISLYQKFGLKPNDARAFNGNIRQIKDEREYVDLNKYMVPGQIQIFTLNKLDPSKIDKFVSTVIASIFRSNLQESPNLRVMIVFDEVHRLLSKFGGSGEGFLQIERAAREFRKWGFGLMLVSQVLSDFVGEIKANISTEIQMRTRDEGDLNRVKSKYGESVLQSLVKASVGVGAIVNPAYNNGLPYFVNFRPILHDTRRLTDEELEKYNRYNEIYDDLEYQVEQLEKEGVDIFDLKMELKLILDKIKTGSFSVVDIYLEGLKPRVEKEWEKLGKKPSKRELKLVEEDVIIKAIKLAQEERKKLVIEEKIKPVETKQEDIMAKIVPYLILDNGFMISSLKELKEVLSIIDSEVFKIHVNDKKNDFADWIEKNFKENTLVKNIRSLKTKSDFLKAIDEFEKSKSKTEEKEEKK